MDVTKDRDQLTPSEPEDQGKLGPKRSAAREAEGPVDESTGKGPASSGADPSASSTLGHADGERYR